ncbi:MAG: methyltransferase [Gemmatimonadota bacterium]|nr:MAG: methyltransferase [Gemmatimonadota bacterium]
MEKEIDALRNEASAFMRSQVLLVANQYDLFTRIEGRRLKASEISDILGTDGRATRMLLDALCGMNYLEKHNGRYRNSEVSSKLLVASSPHYQGDSLRHRYRLWSSWSALRNVVKTGVPPEEPHGEEVVAEKERTRDYILAMENIGRISADRLAENIDLTDVQLLLDLGGGPGTYAVAFARQYPGLRAVVYDLPEVCPITEEQIAQEGFTDRVTTKAGDFLVDELGSGYDMIFVSNVLHMYSLVEIRHILSKCFHALNPDGRIAVKDFFLNEDRSGPLFSQLFAVNMLLRTRAGDTYTFGQIEGALTEAGLRRLRREKCTEESWLIFGEKERGCS